MGGYTASVVTLGLAVALAVGLDVRRRGLARAVLARAPLDLPPDASEWVLPKSRLDYVDGCAISSIGFVLLLVTGLRSGRGWPSLFVPLIVCVLALKLGAVLANAGRPLSPVLKKYAARAREQANTVTSAGDPETGALALELAEWIERLRRNAPDLTYDLLDWYYTPHQVADILDDYLSGSDDYEIHKWLGRPAHVLYQGPEEEIRVALLEEARREVAEDPTPDRLREIVTRLRQ